MKHWGFVIIGLTVALYLAVVAVGLRAKGSADFAPGAQEWSPPLRSTIPPGAKGDSIRRGEQIFNDTPVYAPQYARAVLSCGSCHAQGGIQPYAIPVVGVAAAFPMFSQRAGRMISLRDRTQECFVRSEDGGPLPDDAPEMQALVDYMEWLSQPEPGRRAFEGRGLVTLPPLEGDVLRGARIFREQCAGCHGEQGEGNPPLFPPLWGSQSFNDGAGMHDIAKMARFVQHNMPQNRTGILSAQDAYDVAAFIHTQPRPAFNPAFKKY